jgi:hypothetical protein
MGQRPGAVHEEKNNLLRKKALDETITGPTMSET